MGSERAAWGAVLLLLGSRTTAHGDTPLEVAALHYESPGLVAPTLAFAAPRADGSQWRLRLTGWTLGGEWRPAPQGRRTFVLAAAWTPLNAHASNSVYRDGVRDPALAWSHRTLELGVGLDLRHSRQVHSTWRVLGLYEHVRGPTAALERRWRTPFVGLESTVTLARRRAVEAFGTRLDGVEAELRLSTFTGARTWAQIQARTTAGRRSGPLHWRLEAAGALGHDLDVVSAFLVGGCWDAVPGALPGHRYAEFRVARAGIVSGGADLRVARRWDVGWRSGLVVAPGLTRGGHAARLATQWSGLVLHGGVGIPAAARGSARAVIFAGATVAVFGRPSSW